MPGHESRGMPGCRDMSHAECREACDAEVKCDGYLMDAWELSIT